MTRALSSVTHQIAAWCNQHWPTVVIVGGTSAVLACLVLGLGLQSGVIALGLSPDQHLIVSAIFIAAGILIGLFSVLAHDAATRPRWSDRPRLNSQIGLVSRTEPCSSCGRPTPAAQLKGWIGGYYCADCFEPLAAVAASHDQEVA